MEKNPQVGGCLQSFRRHGQIFDTGVHYVGGLGEGEILHRLFEPFGLNRLPWQQLDRDGFDEVIYKDKTYSFPNGYDDFKEKMSDYFPSQREAMANYVQLLRETQDGLQDMFDHNPLEGHESPELLGKSAHRYLRGAFSDDTLCNVLAGTSLKMELNDTLPLYLFAQTNGTFIQSAWRLKGGGSQMAEVLADGIRSHGGKVLTASPVTGLTVKERRVTGVTVNGTDTIECDIVISDIHPNLLMAMLPEEAIRRPYRARICALPNSAGMFTAHLQLKEGKVP